MQFDKFYNIIDGKQRGSPRTYQGINPSTKEKLWDVPIGSERDVNDAVAAGQRAFKEWSRKSLDERRQVCRKFIDLWAAYENDFTELLMKENGKPRYAAHIEVTGAMNWWEHHVNLEMPVDKYEDDDKVITTTYKPLGVVGGKFMISSSKFDAFIFYRLSCHCVSHTCQRPCGLEPE